MAYQVDVDESGSCTEAGEIIDLFFTMFKIPGTKKKLHLLICVLKNESETWCFWKRQLGCENEKYQKVVSF